MGNSGAAQKIYFNCVNCFCTKEFGKLNEIVVTSRDVVLVQISVLLATMVCTALYVYIQPYENFYVNILETVVLTDLLLLLSIASTEQFQVNNDTLCAYVHMFVCTGISF